MSRKTKRFVRLGCYLFLTGVISGCAAVALAPVVPLVGGLMGNKSQVVIDEATVDPQLREFLPATSRIAIMSQDSTALYAAEHIEMNSNYQVSLVAPPEAASPSQAKRHMVVVCDGTEEPDMVLYFRAPRSDAGGGTVAKGALTGRSKFNLELVTDVLRCENGWRSQFITRGEINQGIYNADQTKMNQILGQGFSLALLRLAGKETPES